MPSRIRVQFDCSPSVITNLDSLVTILNVSSRAEVVQRAMSILDRVTKEKLKNGGELIFRRSDGTEFEIVFF